MTLRSMAMFSVWMKCETVWRAILKELASPTTASESSLCAVAQAVSAAENLGWRMSSFAALLLLMGQSPGSVESFLSLAVLSAVSRLSSEFGRRLNGMVSFLQ